MKTIKETQSFAVYKWAMLSKVYTFLSVRRSFSLRCNNIYVQFKMLSEKFPECSQRQLNKNTAIYIFINLCVTPILQLANFLCKYLLADSTFIWELKRRVKCIELMEMSAAGNTAVEIHKFSIKTVMLFRKAIRKDAWACTNQASESQLAFAKLNRCAHD